MCSSDLFLINKEFSMPRICEVCGKGVLFGHKVSHANNKSQKVSRPNLQRVIVVEKGTHRRKLVCTRCLRSHAISKG